MIKFASMGMRRVRCRSKGMLKCCQGLKHWHSDNSSFIYATVSIAPVKFFGGRICNCSMRAKPFAFIYLGDGPEEHGASEFILNERSVTFDSDVFERRIGSGLFGPFE